MPARKPKPKPKTPSISIEDQLEAKLKEAIRKGPPRSAQLKRMARLREKRDAGQPLTPREQRELDSFIQPMAAASPSDWVGSREKLAAALNCHPNSIPRWLRQFRDAPEAAQLKRANGDYHVPTWRALLERHGIDIAAAAEADAGQQSLAELRRLREAERLAKERRENALADGTLIPRAEAIRLLTESHERVKLLCRQIWEDELPPILHGLTAAQIRLEARKANDRLCELAREACAQLVTGH